MDVEFSRGRIRVITTTCLGVYHWTCLSSNSRVVPTKVFECILGSMANRISSSRTIPKFFKAR